MELAEGRDAVGLPSHGDGVIRVPGSLSGSTPISEETSRHEA
jgi:hypothetical protein